MQAILASYFNTLTIGTDATVITEQLIKSDGRNLAAEVESCPYSKKIVESALVSISISSPASLRKQCAAVRIQVGDIRLAPQYCSPVP